MAKKKTVSEPSFETSFEALQKIVVNLEDGDLSLAESLKNYEDGIKRLQECYAALDQAEQKIQRLARIDEDGNLVTENFEPLDDLEATPGAVRKSTRSKSRKIKKNDELF